MRVLHVLNYGWPYIDGYTVRSMGLIAAQRRHLDGLEPVVATSPFPAFEKTRDPSFRTETWAPQAQHRLGNVENWVQALERPAVGLAPRTTSVFKQALDRLIERRRPDLIHAHHPHHVGHAAQAAARRHGLPLVYELRCFNGDYDLSRARPRYRVPYYQLRGRLRNALEHRVCRNADAVVTISDGLARRIVGNGVPAERAFVVRNSVDTDQFSPGPDASGDERLHIGYATSFSEIENLDLLVRNAARFQQALRDHHGRDLRITIAGDGGDRARLQHLVEKHGLQHIVKLPGFVSYGEMPAFYRGLDLFVVPRGETPVTRDTTPLKPLEALASGVPVLATDLPALRELLDDQSGARFFAPTPNALERALLRFADQPWTAERGVETRNWTQEAGRYEAVYEHALDRATAPAA